MILLLGATVVAQARDTVALRIEPPPSAWHQELINEMLTLRPGWRHDDGHPELSIRFAHGADNAVDDDRPTLFVVSGRDVIQRQQSRHGYVVVRGDLADHIALIRKLSPLSRKVTVFYDEASPWSTLPQPDVIDGIALRFHRVNQEAQLGPSLRQYVDRADAILLAPGSRLFNLDTAKVVLLTAYRMGLPVFGPDFAYVAVGSAAAMSVSPRSIAQRVVDQIDHFLDHRQWPDTDVIPADIRINQHVSGAFNFRYRDSDHIELFTETLP